MTRTRRVERPATSEPGWWKPVTGSARHHLTSGRTEPDLGRDGRYVDVRDDVGADVSPHDTRDARGDSDGRASEWVAHDGRVTNEGGTAVRPGYASSLGIRQHIAFPQDGPTDERRRD